MHRYLFCAQVLLVLCSSILAKEQTYEPLSASVQRQVSRHEPNLDRRVLRFSSSTPAQPSITNVAAKSISSVKSSSTSSAKHSSTSSAKRSSTSSQKLSASPTTKPQPGRFDTPRKVFAHYMLITRPPNGDYTNDMQMAKAAGIDAFAINYGGYNTDFNVQEKYLADFYAAALANGFACYLNFDTTSVNDPAMIVRLTNQYRDHPAQVQINGKVLISTFTPYAVYWDWQNDVLNHVPNSLFLLGTCSDDATATFNQPFDGAFTWIHPTKTFAQEYSTDNSFDSRSTVTNKIWMPGVASWFFKRFSAGENWDHAQDDTIFIDRWMHLLDLSPDFIQILTWNDWGESHYIGPADVTNACPSCTWSKFDHSAFLKISKIFIKAYKSGRGRNGFGSSPCVAVDPADEDVFFFYRTQPAKTLGTGDTLPLPLDAGFFKDDVFVVAALNSSANVELTTGTRVNKRAAPMCLTKFGVPFAQGQQSLRALRNNKPFVQKKGPVNIAARLSSYNGNVVAI